MRLDHTLDIFLLSIVNLFSANYKCSYLNYENYLVQNDANGLYSCIVHIKCYEAWKTGVNEDSRLLWIRAVAVHSGIEKLVDFECYRHYNNDYLDFSPNVQSTRNLTLWVDQKVIMHIHFSE